MRLRAWPLALALLVLLGAYLLLNCGEKSTQPEDELNVSNDNPFCGLAAGFVRNSAGEGLQGATICITPLSPAAGKSAQSVESLQGFMNYPNPFSSDTYFTYFLMNGHVQGLRISVYNLTHELVRQFPNAPISVGPDNPNKLHLDGLDQQGVILPDGLYPCEALILSAEDTTSTQIALAKGINIPSDGELQSYRVTTHSDGKYVIADVLLNIILRITNVMVPEDSIDYPGNWPYAERDLEIGQQFILQASTVGYAAAMDTITLAAGQVTRADFTLR